MLPGRRDGGRHSRLIRHAGKLGQQNPTVKQILQKMQKQTVKLP
jgi:Mn-dependent DtxR family transcriptional regulator